MAIQHRIPVEETFSWQRPVISMALSTPPVNPSKGDRYVVGTSGTGAWASHDKAIAWYDGSAWQFDVPSQGWSVYNKANDSEYHYNGTVWSVVDTANTMHLVANSVAGHLAALDANGQATDSGVTTPVYDAALGSILITL